MKYIFTFLLAFAFHSAIAQPQNQDEVSNMLSGLKDQLMRAYNDNELGGIMGVLGEEMHRDFDEAGMKRFFAETRQELGHMHEWELKRTIGREGYYKVRFDNKEMLGTLKLSHDGRLAGISLKPYKLEDYPVMDRNITKMSLPFGGEWMTEWGGENPDVNQHWDSEAQRHAIDFVMVDDKGKHYKNNGRDNEDYYAFGQNVLAPCDAMVYEAVDGVRDNAPGETNRQHTAGNTVMLKTANNEFIVLQHLKRGSLKVKAGDNVKKGEVLAACGNSGNSTEPHIHLHIQNTYDDNFAAGARCHFEKVKLTQGAKAVAKDDYSPVRKDKVRGT